MKKQQSYATKIFNVLQQANGKEAVVKICEKEHISRATFYRWRRIYGGYSESDIQELLRLLDENKDLKKNITALDKDITALKHRLKKCE